MMATISRYLTKAGEPRWRVRYRTPDNRQTDKRGFRRKIDAEDYLVEVEGRKRRGEYVAQAAGKALVGDLGAEWVKRQRGHLKPNSYKAIESRWRVHVEPRWKRTPVVNVAYSDVQAWVSDLAVIRGAKTVQSAWSVLHSILDDAVRDRRIASNPAHGVKLPRIVKRPHVYLTGEQLHALARASGRYAPLVLLLGLTGLRWGEAAALRVSDVNFLKRSVRVVENATGGKVGTTKSGKHRTVYVPAYVITELSAAAAGKGRDALLWPSATGGHLKPPSPHDSWLSGAVKRCQAADDTFPRVTAHDLRHTAASLAISAGANVKAVQRMLGHASAAMTLDTYAGLFDDDQAAVADKLQEIVGKMWAPGAGAERVGGGKTS